MKLLLKLFYSENRLEICTTFLNIESVVGEWQETRFFRPEEKNLNFVTTGFIVGCKHVFWTKHHNVFGDNDDWGCISHRRS